MAQLRDKNFMWWARDLLELGIVIALILFVVVIYAPRAIWNEEEDTQNDSRFRMENVYAVLDYYKQLTGEPTNEGLWALMVVNAARDSLTSDSTFLGEQIIHLPGKDASVDIFHRFDAVYDTTFGFLKSRKDTLVDTVFSIIMSADEGFDTSFVRLEHSEVYRKDSLFVSISDTVISSHVEVVSYYESYVPDSSMFLCPLTNLPYGIVTDTSNITVSSPIKKIYKEPRFLVFSFKSGSHGKIENGSRSWDRF